MTDASAPQHREGVDGDLAAGDFSTWLSTMRDALSGTRAADVPCGDCTACCTSSQFIHVGPDEHDARAHIPGELLFPAPGLPRGHSLMGYDEHGHCPMFRDNQCSIYDHRPVTCRTYDCRVFPAAGVSADSSTHSAIARQSGRWVFTHATDSDHLRHAAVRAAAIFLHEHPQCCPGGRLPTNPTQVAVLAVEIHDLFVGVDEHGDQTLCAPSPDVVSAAVTATARRST
jgi:Fe-S-cluster containining protein